MKNCINKISLSSNIKKIIVHIIPILFIWICGLYYINDALAPRILGDEFGYWSAGAWMAGYNWSDAASWNSYYGYGYGVFLAIILLLPVSQTLKYKIAIGLNVFFLTIIYFLAYSLIGKINEKMKCSLKIIIALCAALGSGGLYYSQYTLVEELILLIYWILVYLAYDLLKKFSTPKAITFVLLLAYSFAVHQRMLGIIMVGILYIIFLLLKNKVKIKNWFFVGIVFCISIIGVLYIKECYQESYLTNTVSSVLSVNEFGAQINKINAIFTWSGFKSFCIGIIGKLYYTLSVSYIMIGIVLFVFIKKIIELFREKKLSDSFVFLMFLFGNVIVSILISNIFMLEYQSRFDLLIYGRYHEFTMGPLLMMSFLILISQGVSRLFMISMLFFYEAITCFVNSVLPYGTSRSHLFFTTHGLTDILIKNNATLYMVNFKVIIIVILIVSLYELSQILKKNKEICFGLIGLLLLFNTLVTDIVAYNEGCLSWATVSLLKENALAQKIIELDAEDKIYYYAKENRLTVGHLQFLLGDNEIHYFSQKGELEQLPEDAYVITVNNTSLFDEGTTEYKKIKSTDFISLWEPVTVE